MRTVFKALSAVQKELSERGIAKGDTNKHQNYKFRGIDAVLNALAPILAKHGVVLVPSVDESEIRTLQTNQGSAMNHCKVKMSFTFYDSEGDSITHTFHGEAMDSGDKSLNKAATAAYKYFLFQAFTIPVEGTPDADSESHEASEVLQQYTDAQLATYKHFIDLVNRDEAYDALEFYAFKRPLPESVQVALHNSGKPGEIVRDKNAEKKLDRMAEQGINAYVEDIENQIAADDPHAQVLLAEVNKYGDDVKRAVWSRLSEEVRESITNQRKVAA